MAFITATGFVAFAAPLQDRIKIEAVIVTKAELRRHLSATDDDQIIPSSRKELNSAYEDLKQPAYFVVRFLPDRPGHYTGDLEIKIDAQHRITLPVALHYTEGWVEYFIPLSGMLYARKHNSPWEFVEGSPVVAMKWIGLAQK